jgi:hypothetical protein
MRPFYSHDRLLDGDRPYAEVSNKRAVMRENDSRSGGGLDGMTRRKLEITGLQTNRTSRVWSNSRFRRRALAAGS